MLHNDETKTVRTENTKHRPGYTHPFGPNNLFTGYDTTEEARARRLLRVPESDTEAAQFAVREALGLSPDLHEVDEVVTEPIDGKGFVTNELLRFDAPHSRLLAALINRAKEN